MNPPMLMPPVPGRPLILYMIVMDESMGCMLGQHAEFLLQTVGECCSCGSCATDRCVECGKSSIAGVLSAIKGPWAIIYWQVTPSGKFLCV